MILNTTINAAQIPSAPSAEILSPKTLISNFDGSRIAWLSIQRTRELFLSGDLDVLFDLLRIASKIHRTIVQ
jgi:hypothetical protein